VVELGGGRSCGSGNHDRLASFTKSASFFSRGKIEHLLQVFTDWPLFSSLSSHVLLLC